MPITPDIGKLGEQLVAEWLQTQGWVILHHRWRCRWGEIDLITRSGVGARADYTTPLETNRQLPSPNSSLLAFVEVKTRKPGNWDEDGRLAITPSKQAKLRQTAELFLAARSDLADFPCRFDVALVSCQRLSQSSSHAATDEVVQVPPLELGQPIIAVGYQLILKDYIQSAFS